MSKLNKPAAYNFAKHFLPPLILTAIVFVCFSRTLGSYFVADDFGQVSYVSGICHGNWSALISNFTGNYMQIPVMKIYRPCLLLSFIFDYLIWHTNAFGYFLTDILFMAASAIMLYVLLRALTMSWGKNRSTIFSLLSAALFASNPLHCESISFVSGRDNLISAFFYLLTLWCFVKKGQTNKKKFLIIGIISFWIALLSKEMAIGLPVVLTAMYFILPEIFTADIVSPSTQDTKQYSIKERFSLAIKKSMPIWLNTIIYLFVRFFALGTFTGGYTGNIGAGLMSNLAKRWTSLDTVLKIIYPLNLDIFGSMSHYEKTLSTLYIILATLIFIKLLSGKYPLKMLCLTIIWTLTTIAPLYQLWSLGENLAGARFFFFLSMPLAIFIPLLILAPADKISESVNAQLKNQTRIIEALAIVVLCILVLLNINITYKNNIAWVHAGKQTRACLLECQKLARSLAPQKKVALLGIPEEINGAHVIYNGSIFNGMVSKPFAEANYADKFITFKPLFYGIPGSINMQRLKRVLADPNVVGLFIWNENKLTFTLLPSPSHEVLLGRQSIAPLGFKQINTLVASSTLSKGTMCDNVHQICTNDHGLLIAPANADPFQYDFLELTLKASLPKEPIFVFWRGENASNIDWSDSKCLVQKIVLNATSTVNTRIRLSEHWRWFTQGKINRLQLEFLPGQAVQVNNIRLVSARDLIPTIAIANAQANNIGIYPIGKGGVSLDFDARTVKGCAAVKIEISKPNYLFEAEPEEENEQSIMTSLVQSVNKGRLDINSKIFGQSAYYQLRALCLDQANKVIGERSDPLTIQFQN